jgi:hypothetical protein
VTSFQFRIHPQVSDTHAAASSSTAASSSKPDKLDKISDGFVFILRDAIPSEDDSTSPVVLSSLGYHLEKGSIAIEFDAKQDKDKKDPNDNHVSIHLRDHTSDTLSAVEIKGKVVRSPFAFRSGELISAKIVFDGQKVAVYLQNSEDSILSLDVIDLPSLIRGSFYAGFSSTSSSHTKSDILEICSWEFSLINIHTTQASSSSSASSSSHQDDAHSSDASFHRGDSNYDVSSLASIPCSPGFVGDNCEPDLSTSAHECTMASMQGCLYCTSRTFDCRWCQSTQKCVVAHTLKPFQTAFFDKQSWQRRRNRQKAAAAAARSLKHGVPIPASTFKALSSKDKDAQVPHAGQDADEHQGDHNRISGEKEHELDVTQEQFNEDHENGNDSDMICPIDSPVLSSSSDCIEVSASVYFVFKLLFFVCLIAFVISFAMKMYLHSRGMSMSLAYEIVSIIVSGSVGAIAAVGLAYIINLLLVEITLSPTFAFVCGLSFIFFGGRIIWKTISKHFQSSMPSLPSNPIAAAMILQQQYEHNLQMRQMFGVTNRSQSSRNGSSHNHSLSNANPNNINDMDNDGDISIASDNGFKGSCVQFTILIFFSLLIVATGVLCFVLEKEWSASMSVTAKIPCYALVSMSLCFVLFSLANDCLSITLVIAHYIEDSMANIVSKSRDNANSTFSSSRTSSSSSSSSSSLSSSGSSSSSSSSSSQILASASSTSSSSASINGKNASTSTSMHSLSSSSTSLSSSSSWSIGHIHTLFVDSAVELQLITVTATLCGFYFGYVFGSLDVEDASRTQMDLALQNENYYCYPFGTLAGSVCGMINEVIKQKRNGRNNGKNGGLFGSSRGSGSLFAMQDNMLQEFDDGL